MFAPLGVKACLNWTLCDAEMQARKVTLYRHTGEVAADGPARLPPVCTMPVSEGVTCDLERYLPGTNASIFSPQGGVRIGMVDLATIGQAFYRSDADPPFLRRETVEIFARTLNVTGQTTLFCVYGLHIQLIEAPIYPCHEDKLFGDGIPRIGHSGEAYGLQSGLWVDPLGNTGFVYFTTEVPPPVGGEDTGGFSAREQALMARARAILAERAR